MQRPADNESVGKASPSLSVASPHPAPPRYVEWRLCDGKNGEMIDTYLQAEINCSYADLVAVFGKPNRGPHKKGDKTDASWGIQFFLFGGHFGPEPATIYNYKDGKNYEGKHGLAVQDIRDWHIGGKKSDVVGYIASMLLNRDASGAAPSAAEPTQAEG